MNVFGTFSTLGHPLPVQPPSLASHDHGGAHHIRLGVPGVHLSATTEELSQFIAYLLDVLGQVRVADLRAAMQPLPEVAL